MSTTTGEREKLTRKTTLWLDQTLVPIAAAVVCMLVLVQGLMSVPSIRARLTHSFAQPVGGPVAASLSARVRLAITPWPQAVSVRVGETTYTPDANGVVYVTVRPGDSIAITRQRVGPTLYVSVDHDDPNLLTPAPGQVLTLNTGDMEATFPAAQFLP